MDDPLYRDPALAQFYDVANQWGADFDYCVSLASNATSVLDLGCGTGELASALAQNRKVTGVDPAALLQQLGPSTTNPIQRAAQAARPKSLLTRRISPVARHFRWMQ